MLLKGKNAIVTGGSRGIGAAIVRAFVEQGARVVFTYLTSIEKAEALLTELGSDRVKAIACNGSVAEEVRATVAEAVDWLGGLDILVNNAGITKDGLLIRMSEQDWDSVVNTNLKASFLFSKAVLKYMLRNGGSLIHMSSVVGITGNAGQANYAASKSGIIGLSNSISMEMGAKQIRSNVIAPGFIDTDMSAQLESDLLDQYISQVPLKRMGKVNEVADLAVYLASDMSSYITGQVISVCGGLNR
jgi:3-oxoacyl-[acyl-carrier protein] reductase